MGFYITVIIVSVLFSVIADLNRGKVLKARGSEINSKRNIRIWHICAAISAMVPFMVSALRYGIGTDYFRTYVPRYYSYYSDPNAPLDWEPLFWLLCKILVRITSNPQWLFVITSAIIIGCIWYSAYAVSAIPCFSIMLFFISRQFFISMNGVRQYIGISLVCVGIVFLSRKKYGLYLLCVFIGTMFHYSTAIFAPLLLMAFVTIDPLESGIIIGAFSVFSDLFYPVFHKLVMFTPYAKYIGSEFDTANRYSSWTIFELLLVHFIISILIDRHPIRDDEKLLRFFYNVNVICVLVSFNLHLIPNSERISWSLELPSIFLIPEIIARIEDKKKKYIITTLIIIVYSYVMYNRVKGGDHQVYPYDCVPTLSIILHDAGILTGTGAT